MTTAAEVTPKDVAGSPPKLTAVTPARSLPVIVTLVPPAIGPLDGATAATTGPGVELGGPPPVPPPPDPPPPGDEPATCTATEFEVAPAEVTVEIV